MTLRHPSSRGHSYLLRVWEERSTQPPDHVLRLSVETLDGARRGFDSPEALVRYLTEVAVTLAQEAERDAGECGIPS